MICYPAHLWSSESACSNIININYHPSHQVATHPSVLSMPSPQVTTAYGSTLSLMDCSVCKLRLGMKVVRYQFEGNLTLYLISYWHNTLLFMGYSIWDILSWAGAIIFTPKVAIKGETIQHKSTCAISDYHLPSIMTNHREWTQQSVIARRCLYQTLSKKVKRNH